MNTQLRSFEFSDYLLDDELLKSIRKQQNETLKTRIECLKSFRERLSGLIDFQCISFEELLRLIFLITEALLLNELTQLTGITAIVDFNEWSYQQIRYIFPSRLPICYNVFHSACTLRIKYLHLVNTPGLLYYLQEYLISSFSQKIKDRIKCYPVNSSLETLYRHVPPEILPEEYGGSLPSSSMVDLNSIINEQKSYFQRQLQYGLLDEKMN
ncbi:alpha-tocopherol transfer protein-like protein [Trichonephila clavata]|uniref:Alpha-tocopherol transfer protein-like protein n=1 Tax=Trichonephila clavata TaxID=2740835 RepID=A0A8X6HI36_TRICU|nr:alpha-tocopherol transfer protein-like protein [Trichonephila clavata]